MKAAGGDKSKEQVGKMQRRKVSWPQTVTITPGCITGQGAPPGPRRFHLQDQGFLLSRQVFAGFLLIYRPGLGFFKEATGVDCPVSPLFQPILFLSLSLHSTQISRHLCMHTLVEKETSAQLILLPTTLKKSKKDQFYIYIYIYDIYINIYMYEIAGNS